jgi:iron complex transport system permease protein
MSEARRLLVALAALGGALALVAGGALFIGSAPVAPGDVVAALSGRAAPEAVERAVVLGLRLPRIAVAALAGGALAVAGAGLQALTRNPLAEPAVLGVSSGAAFGVVAGQLFGLGLGIVEALGLAGLAFAGAFVAGGTVYLIASRTGGLAAHDLLLAGVIVGIFFSSAITVLISIVDVDRLGGVIHWLLGNIAPVPPGSLAVFAVLAAAGLALTVSQARPLNLLALGEEPARQLGVRAAAVRGRIFVAAALLTSAAVAFAGPIGFVGLVVPHLLRLGLGPDNRVLLPCAFAAGAVFLLAADTLARNLVAPAELAVGVITAFCGAPFFIYLLRRRGAEAEP